MLDQQPGGLPALYPAGEPCWSFREPPACITVLCPAWWAPAGPRGQVELRAISPLTAPREQGRKSGDHLGWGPGVVTRPWVFLQESGEGPCTGVFAGGALGCLVPRLQTCVEDGRRVEVRLVLCPPSWSSHSSLRGQSWVRAGTSLKTWVSCVLVYASDRSAGSGLKSHSLCSEEASLGSMEVALPPSGPREGGGRVAEEPVTSREVSPGPAHPE